MTFIIQLRGDSAARWTTVNPVLHARELGVETDTGLGKLGDGVTAWNTLSYWSPSPSGTLTNPMTAAGDLIIGGSAGTPARLAGNATTARKFLRQTGTGSAANAQVWDTLQAGDIPSLAYDASGAAATETARATAAETLLAGAGTAWLNVAARYGAKGDGAMLSDGAITTSTNAFTSSTASFVSGDVGKTIAINGAGVAGANLVTTIASVSGAHSVTLTANAGTTVSGAYFAYGTLNDSAFSSAITAAHNTAGLGGAVVYVPGGTYLISAAMNWKVSGLTVQGDGPNCTSIVQTTDNTPVVQVAGQYQRISGLTFTYAYQQSAAQTSSLCMTLGDNTVGSCFGSTFANLLLQWGSTSLTLDPNLTVGAGVFSCTFTDIVITRFTVSAISINGNNGLGGANCTGCMFSSIYISNTTNGSTGTATGPVVFFKNWDELVCGQFNIEHSIVSTQDVLSVSSVGNAVFSSLHFEALTTPANGQAIIHLSGAGTTVINGLTARFCTFSGSASNPVVKFFGTGLARLTVNGSNESSNTVTTPSHPYVDFGTATNCRAQVYGQSASQTTANAVNANSGCLSQFGWPIDLTAGSIQQLGTQSAGSNTVAADSGHVHPATMWTPQDNGLLVSSGGDPGLITSTAILTAGTLYLVKLPIRYALTITSLMFLVSVIAAGTSTTSFAGLYSPAGTLLTGSSDIGTPLKSGGPQSLALTTPQALTPASTAFVWAALLVNFGSTQPTLFKGGAITNNVPNAGLTAATYRWATNGTGLSALPGSITPSSNSSASALTLWCAGI